MPPMAGLKPVSPSLESAFRQQRQPHSPTLPPPTHPSNPGPPPHLPQSCIAGDGRCSSLGVGDTPLIVTTPMFPSTTDSPSQDYASCGGIAKLLKSSVTLTRIGCARASPGT